MRRALMILLPVVVIAAGWFGAWTMIKAREKPEPQPVEVQPPLVRVIKVQLETVRLTVQAEGTVRPRTETEMVPEVSGRVVEISPSLAAGGFFEEGDVLLKIDPREYELDVVRSRAAVAQAELRVATEEQEAEVARKEWESLGEGEPTSLVLREPQIAEAKAALASAQAALDRAKYDLERTTVRAPYAGRVWEKRIDRGQFVTRGSQIARIYSVDVAEVRLPIPDQELAFVDLPLAYRGRSGNANRPRVKIRATFAGKKHEWRGRIVRTEGEIDAQSRMVRAVAQIEDPYGYTAHPGRPPLAVGMFVEAEIQGRLAPNVVSLPRTALRAGDQVLVVDEESRLRFRAVEILRAERDRVIVRSGLREGERVCVSIVETAVEGMKVRTVEQESTPDVG